MKTQLMARLVVIGGAVLGLVLSACQTRLDGREIRCAQNLRSIASAARDYRTESGHLPANLAELQVFGLDAADTNCPSAPPDYILHIASTNFVVCPTHRIHADRTPYRVTSDLVAHTSGRP